MKHLKLAVCISGILALTAFALIVHFDGWPGSVKTSYPFLFFVPGLVLFPVIAVLFGKFARSLGFDWGDTFAGSSLVGAFGAFVWPGSLLFLILLLVVSRRENKSSSRPGRPSRRIYAILATIKKYAIFWRLNSVAEMLQSFQLNEDNYRLWGKRLSYLGFVPFAGVLAYLIVDSVWWVWTWLICAACFLPLCMAMSWFTQDDLRGRPWYPLEKPLILAIVTAFWSMLGVLPATISVWLAWRERKSPGGGNGLRGSVDRIVATIKKYALFWRLSEADALKLAKSLSWPAMASIVSIVCLFATNTWSERGGWLALEVVLCLLPVYAVLYPTMLRGPWAEQEDKDLWPYAVPYLNVAFTIILQGWLLLHATKKLGPPMNGARRRIQQTVVKTKPRITWRGYHRLVPAS